MTGPLHGVRVIDLTTIYSGPIAASILGDHGADVIKVETPWGDFMRGRNPAVNAPFAMMNRNKRSVVLDLRMDEGKNVFRRLIESADVCVENFRPQVMDRLGFGWDQLQAINPRLIYASITGVGRVGPYANRRVYDAVIQAISGMGTLQSDPASERPVLVNTLICDKITAVTAAQNICSALYARERSGRGQRVEVSMLDSSLFFLWPDAMNSYSFVGRETPRAFYQSHANFIRQTKDGYVAAMPVQPSEWAGLFAALELDNLLEDDPRFNTPQARAAHPGEFSKALNDAYASLTTDEIVERFERNGVPFAEVNTRMEVLSDPQIVEMNALMEFEHPAGGRMRQPRPPGLFSDTPTGIFRYSPQLGEHTSEVLQEVGYTTDEVNALRENGTFGVDEEDASD